MRFTSLAAATALSASTLAAQINITLLLTPLLANPSQLSASTSATLTGAVKEYTSHLDTKLGFTFPDVPTGTYLLDVNAPGPEGFVFAPLRIDVVKPSEEIEGGALPASGSKRDVGDKVEDDREVVLAWGTWRGNEWTNKGEVVEAMEWNGVGGGKSFGIKAVGKREYLVDRQGWSPLSILKNPMILLALGAGIMTFGLPELIKRMDPEMRAEFEERQKSNPMNSILSGGATGPKAPGLDFDAAGWLAGQGKKEGVKR